MSKLRVEGLYSYPIKSCAGTELSEGAVTKNGLIHDREFMVVDENNVFISQRQRPELALVVPTITEAVPGLTCMDVNAPDMPNLDIVHEPARSRPVDHTEVYVHGNPMDALIMDIEASNWFSRYLDQPVRMVSVDPKSPRPIKGRYQTDGASNRTGFADAFPMLLASQKSLDSLNITITDGLKQEAVPMDRFRPNIVVDGEALSPYEEDFWRRIRVGEMFAYVVRPCKRCEIPDIDQTAGDRPGKIVRQALALTRRGTDMTKAEGSRNGVFFAQNLNHEYAEGIILKRGDEVVVLDDADECNVRLRA